MLIKRAFYPGVQDGELTVQLIEPGEMVKTASGLMPAVQSFINTLRPDPSCIYALVNAMGYSEFFRSNSNNDWYGQNKHLDFNGLLHAPPNWGTDPAADMARGKKWYYGFPTYYNATVYAHHKNSNPDQLGFGEVIFVAPNPLMKRIELVLRVDREKAALRGRSNVLDRIQAHERVDVSMGAKVPLDMCSICTDWATVRKALDSFDPTRHIHPGIAVLHWHKRNPIRGVSVTRADYCECMKTQKGMIFPDGRKVFVYNDFPRFFDISFVWIGADRTARVMWFLSDSKEPPPKTVSRQAMNPVYAYLREMLQKKAHVAPSIITAMEKSAGGRILVKKSEIEKEIPAAWVKNLDLHAQAEPDLPGDVLADAVRRAGAQRTLSSLGGLGITLRPREFRAVIGQGMPDGPAAMRALANREDFSTECSDIDDTYGVQEGHVLPDLMRSLMPMAPLRSLFTPELGPRLMHAAAPVRSTRIIIIQSMPMAKLAAQYNGYRISLLEKAASVFPKYTEVWEPDVDMLMKVSSVPLGALPLLLGAGPVLHLLSAHLQEKKRQGQQLGTMANFIANNPTFTTMTTIGAGLRMAMGIRAAGGLGSAAVKVLGALKSLV